MGYGTFTGVRGFRFALIALAILLPMRTQAAPTDYTQTATAYQTFFPGLFQNFIGVVPDGAVTDNAFFYTAIPVTTGRGGDGDGDGDGDGPPAPTNLLRRNPVVNTWSNNLQISVDLVVDANNGLVANAIFQALWGGPNYVGGFLSDQNNDPIGFAVYPLAAELGGNGPFLQDVGSAFTVPLLDPVTLPVAMLPMADLDDFSPGIFSGFPFNQWHHTAPFPNDGSNPGFIFGGTAVDSSPNGSQNEVAVVVGASVTPGGDGVTLIPVKIIHDFGAPKGQQPAAGVTPLMADFNGDGCVDLAVLLSMSPDGNANDLVYTLEGDCSGNFDNATPVAHDLGANDLVFDLAAYDADGDAASELVITYPAPGTAANPQNPNPGRIDIVFDPLGTFQVVSGPAIPAGMQPLFAVATDCDQEQNTDDLLVTGEELFTPPIDLGEIPPLTPSDVLCFLDGGDTSVVVYSKEKSALNVPSQAGGRLFPGIIVQSEVGFMGCGQGWTGVAFYILGGDGGGNMRVPNNQGDGDGDGDISGINHILMAEFADCPGGNGGGGGGGGFANGEFGGSGCLGSLNPQATVPAKGWWLLALPFLVVLGLRRRIGLNPIRRNKR